MSTSDFGKTGARLAAAFRLNTRPLVVYGADTPPSGSVHLASVNRCFAMTMFLMATDEAPPVVHVGRDDHDGCCPGGIAHTGFTPEKEEIWYFVSTGRSDIRGGAAEYLKSSPEMVEKSFRAVGTITPPGPYLVVSTCDALPDPNPGVRSVCCFGTAEQIRNMAALVHFDRDDPFSPVIVPWGPSCATFISYPAGLAANAPVNTAFMGPQDPTQNYGLPPDMMAMGIPAGLAVRMERNLDRSFLVKRPHVAFPSHSGRRS
ncbi:MAG TPA: DUF169 domain-containing protein [Methanoregulaceae archaeon]|nr:DUF169 domain-containing protein [Methanoregulaceae archaeon]